MELEVTLAKIKIRFFCPGMRSSVEDWCQQCPSCASRKSPSQTPRAPSVPSVVGYLMERIVLELLGPLPTTCHVNKHILVFGNYFTRVTQAYVLPNQEAVTIARVLVNEWIRHFGVPDAIHSEQGANFEGHFFTKVGKVLSIEKTRTTPYHPNFRWPYRMDEPNIVHDVEHSSTGGEMG